MSESVDTSLAGAKAHAHWPEVVAGAASLSLALHGRLTLNNDLLTRDLGIDQVHEKEKVNDP